MKISRFDFLRPTTTWRDARVLREVARGHAVALRARRADRFCDKMNTPVIETTVTTPKMFAAIL